MLRQRIIEEVGTLGLQSGGCLSVETTRPQIPPKRTANRIPYVSRQSHLLRSALARPGHFHAEPNRAGRPRLTIPKPHRPLHVTLGFPFLDRVTPIVLATPLCDRDLHLCVMIF